jgi:hypothetical protein
MIEWRCLIHCIELRAVRKSLHMGAVSVQANEGLEQSGIDLSTMMKTGQDRQGPGERRGLFIGTTGPGEGFEDAGDGKNAGRG